ncbi:MAG TPA: aminomethyltransferase family protein [Gammaproteobacteria bacterium]|nr:aminomethyltransferase family protein [Gammaproteobacteria bacterium]
MPIGTPFQARTEPLCTSRNWRPWSGHFVAGSYGDFVQPEYAAIRHSAALIDVSPLYKYSIDGPQGSELVDRVMTRSAARMQPGQIVYTPWCDADGMVRQEGTVFRFADARFQINAAEPALDWLRLNAAGLDAGVHDQSLDIAALSLQGPLSRDVLRAAGVAGIGDLQFFHLIEAQIDGTPVTVSRTGYTGDLGYEIWLPAGAAVETWDALMRAGEPYHITPCGLAAMDIARLETGFILINVDYVSAETARLAEDKVSPYEIGLHWAVKLDKGPFVGRRALEVMARQAPMRRIAGLAIDWEPLERIHLEAGVMPDLPLMTCREPVPVYAAGGGRQIGRVTTRVWSTLLKKYIALATVEARFAEPGREVAMEITVRHARRRVPARVVKTPFFRPERMRA